MIIASAFFASLALAILGSGASVHRELKQSNKSLQLTPQVPRESVDVVLDYRSELI
jgi:hypothetical protein